LEGLLMQARTGHFLLVAITMVCVAGLTDSAAGWQDQSPAQLRIENQQLRDRIEELERDLQEKDQQLSLAQRKIDALESTNARLRDRFGNRGGSAPDTSDDPVVPMRETAAVPEYPFASPASMLAMLEQDYQAATNGTTFATSGDRTVYMRTIRRWAAQKKGDISGPVRWTIRVISSSGGRGKVRFDIEVLEDGGDLPIGEVFQIEVLGRFAQKLKDAVGGDPVQLEGMFTGTIVIDEALEASEDPMFIGPFAMLMYRLKIRSLR
jgi:hypothetical protein